MEESPIILKSFEIISTAGTAKSLLMEALRSAKAGEHEEAIKFTKEAEEMLLASHHVQTELLQAEARGEGNDIGFISVHAQDHLMTTMLLKDMMEHMLELYKRS